jgi:hypothetical protein
MNNTQRGPTWHKIIFGFIFIVFSLSILSQLLLASHMRLTGDDYCYNAVLSREGFWKMQTTSFTEVSMYNGNRYSLNFFSGLFGLLPVIGTPLLIILSVIFWLIGAAGVISEISRLVKRKIEPFEAFAISEVLLSLVLIGAQNLEQSLFWRSGMLPYFLPQVGILLVLWVVLREQRREKRSWLIYPLLFMLGLLFGGFSETGTFLMLGIWGLGLVVTLILMLSGKKRKRFAVVAFVVLIAATLAGLALLYFSPSTALRRVNMPEPLSISALVSLLLVNLKVFFWQVLMRRIIYLLMPLAFGLFIGFIFWVSLDGEKVERPEVKNIIIAGAAILVTGVILIALIFMPATYIFADYPPDRALILAQFVMIFTAALGGVWLSVIVQGLFRLTFKKTNLKNPIFGVLSVIAIVFVIAAPAKLIRLSLVDLPMVTKWSRLWDERHQQLLNAGWENNDEIHVIELDHIVDEVGELSPDPDYWYNNCAEMYYGIDLIAADQPDW